MYKKSLLITLLILLSVSSIFAKVPSWFKKMPETPKGVYLDVGCIGLFNNKTLARDVALHRAAKNISKQIHMELIFELSTKSDGVYNLGLPDFEEKFEEDIYNQVVNNMVVIDSIFTKKYSYYLVQYPASASKVKIVSEKISWGKKPKWIKKPPHDEKYHYGVGQLSNYINKIRAWNETDSFARFALGKNICVKVSTVRKEKNSDKYSFLRKDTYQYYDIVINDCRIIERWYDKKQDAYYSLCKSPRGKYEIVE